MAAPAGHPYTALQKGLSYPDYQSEGERQRRLEDPVRNQAEEAGRRQKGRRNEYGEQVGGGRRGSMD